MIPTQWQHLILSGEVQLIDPPKPQPEDPYDTQEYQSFVEEMAKDCRCEPHSARPCDGVLAGGICDGLNWKERDDFRDGDEEDMFSVL